MKNLLLAIIGVCMIASSVEARPNNKPHTRIVFEDTIPDSLRGLVKKVFGNYKYVTANAQYSFPKTLVIADSAMSELKDLNQNFVPILSLPGKLVFNTLATISQSKLEQEIYHELFHVIKPDKATPIDTFQYRGYTVFAYHGLTVMIRKRGGVHESRLLEEAAANVVGKGFFKPDHLAEFPSYRRVANFLDNMVEQKWIKKRHLIKAQETSDINSIIALMLKKKKRDVTSGDVMLITDALFTYYDGNQQEMREVMETIYKIRGEN